MHNTGSSALEQWIKETRRSLNARIKGQDNAKVEDNNFESSMASNNMADEEDLMAKFHLKHMISECSDTQTVEAIEVEEIRDDRRWLHKIEQELRGNNGNSRMSTSGCGKKQQTSAAGADDIVKRLKAHRKELEQRSSPEIICTIQALFGNSEDSQRIKESISKCDETMEKAKCLLLSESVKPKAPVAMNGQPEPVRQGNQLDSTALVKHSGPLDSIYGTQLNICNKQPAEMSLPDPLVIRTEMDRQSRRQRRLAEVESQIEEKRKLKRLQLLHKCILGWKLHNSTYQTSLKSALVGQRWQTLNRLFHAWHHKAVGKVTERERRLAEAQRMHERQMQMLGELVFTKRTLNQHFHRWKAQWQIKLEERTLTNYRQSRALKVRQFLNKVANPSPSSNSDMNEKANVPAGIEATDIAATTQMIEQKVEGEHQSNASALPRRPLSAPHNNGVTKKSVLHRTKQDVAFIKAMQKREEERRKRKAEAEKRKLERQYEAEQRQQEEERRKRKAEEEKRMQEIERQQELRRIQEEESKQQREMKERMLNNLRIARQYYEQRGLIYYRSICGWRKRMQLHAERELKADTKFQHSVLSLTLHKWRDGLTMKRQEKVKIADQWFAQHACKRALDQWQAQFWESRSRTVELAVMLRKFIEGRTLYRWHSIHRRRLESTMERERRLEQRAEGFAGRHSQIAYLALWRRHCKERKEQKWRQYRAERLRQRAKELLVHSRLQTPLTDMLSR